MNLCSVDACEKPVFVKKAGLCTTHYGRMWRHGDPLAIKRRKKARCEVASCEFVVVGSGLCDRHYRRQRRYGSTDLPERPTACVVTDCTDPLAANGMCDRHYRRTLRGTPDRICPTCGTSVNSLLNAKTRYCSKACTERAAGLKRRESHRRIWLKQYGLTEESYGQILATQGEACAICRGSSPRGRAGSPFFQVDHDHATGRVRGLLCAPCNSALGGFQDDPAILAQAIMYLKAPGADS